MEDQFFYDAAVVSDGHFRLERPRVRALLAKAARLPLVAVVAGAGYGKTEAVYSFLKNHNAVTTWVQLSARDNQSSRFWENIAHAISLYSKNYAAQFAELGFPGTRTAFLKYWSLPERELIPGRKYVFVLDDFHLIENPRVLRFVEWAVEASSVSLANFSTIILSRKELSADLAGLLPKGRAARLDERDLRFTADEMADFFRIQGFKPPPGAIADIEKVTDGWPFAIGLIGMSLKKGAGQENFRGYALSAMKLNIFKMIEREIFSGVSGELRKLLIKLSLIGHPPLELVKLLAPGKAPLEDLSKLGSFVRYDGYLNAYRIHQLFLDYLAQKQNLLTEDEKREVYAKAVQWCVENDYKIDAVLYCEKIGDYGQIIGIANTLRQIASNDIALFMVEAFERFPKSAYEQYGALRVLYTRFLCYAGRIGEARALLLAETEKFEALPKTPEVCRVLLGLYNNIGFLRYFECVFTHSYDFWRWFEKSALCHPASGFVATGPVTVMSLGPYACRVGSEEKGRLEEFTEAVEKSVRHVSATMSGCMYGLDDLVKAETAYYRADTRTCGKFARQALAKAREKGQHEIENRALFFLTRIALAAGDYPAVQETLKQLERQLDAPGYLNRRTYHDITTGWYYVMTQQPARIAQWLKSDFERSDLNTILQGFEYFVKLRYYLSEKRYHALLAVLEFQDSEFRLNAFLFSRVGMKIYESLCHYHLKEREKAMEALAEAYRLARPNGLDMPFIEQGNNMRALAAAAMKDAPRAVSREWLKKIQKKSSTYAKQLARVISERGKANPAQSGVRLTGREAAILTDLSRGLSRAQIAASQNLSINTVKKALQAIYAKLEADGAAGAIRAAGALNLMKKEPRSAL